MLERLPDLAFERFPTDPEIAGRTEQVEDAGTGLAPTGPASVHDIRVLESALVSRLTDERQEPDLDPAISLASRS